MLPAFVGSNPTGAVYQNIRGECMIEKTGTGLANWGMSKVGTPYFYGSKMTVLTEQQMLWLHQHYPSIVTASYMKKARTKGQVGKVNTDCSGLISSYTGKTLGSSQLYSQAYARLPISRWESFAIGTVLWKKGHVGIYVGGGKVAEAKGINYGTIISSILSTKWEYGLTFSWLDYTYKEAIPSNEITYKTKNPYKEPTRELKKGQRGDDVKWLQWELNESGSKLTVDGSFGNKTLRELRAFQQSSKILVDGVCGKQTRKALKAK